MNSAVLGYPADFPAMTLPGVRGDWRIGAAVLASVAIHGFALGWLPGLEGRVDQPQAQPPIHVRLAAELREPVTLAVPPAPTSVTAAQPVRREPAPQRSAPILTYPVPDAARDVPVVRNVEAPVTAPVESPRPGSIPVESRPVAVDPGALAAYGRELAGAVATRQRYPRIALLRQWQGTAVLQLDLAADGRLLGVRVISSSGHDTLDRQALDMVREAVPLPSLPAALAGRPLTVDVPVVFRITS